jgi:hypothetical protein
MCQSARFCNGNLFVCFIYSTDGLISYVNPRVTVTTPVGGPLRRTIHYEIVNDKKVLAFWKPGTRDLTAG